MIDGSPRLAHLRRACAIAFCLCPIACAELADVRDLRSLRDPREHLQEGTAELVLRGPTRGVATHFSVSVSAGQCAGFMPFGWAVSEEVASVYPWGVTTKDGLHRGMALAEPRFVYGASAGRRVQVRAYGSWSTGGPFKVDKMVNCGPVTVSFVPGDRRAYAVEFTWAGKGCGVRVFDASDPGTRVSVEVEELPNCAPPAFPG